MRRKGKEYRVGDRIGADATLRDIIMSFASRGACGCDLEMVMDDGSRAYVGVFAFRSRERLHEAIRGAGMSDTKPSEVN